MTLLQQLRPPANDVVAGVDTHADTHTIAICTPGGSEISTQTFTADGAGYNKMIDVLSNAGNVTAIGVEGTGSYGAGLTRALIGAGFCVKEVLRPSRQVRHLNGKSDAVDALAAARTLISGNGVSQPKDTSTPAESLRLLYDARIRLVAATSSFLHAITSMLVTCPEEIRNKYRPFTGAGLARKLASSRPQGSIHAPGVASMIALRDLARSYLDLTKRSAVLEEQMNHILITHYPAVLNIYGAGTISATRLVITAGGNPERIRSEAAFAALCGVAPIPASSGKTNRHRLNRGGDRRGNAALHRIALIRLQHDEPTQAYAAKRRREGKTDKEILRCLKRFIAREVFRALMNPLQVAPVKNLRAIRHSRNLTLTHVATALQTWPSRISDIETGRRPLPALRQRYETWLNVA